MVCCIFHSNLAVVAVKTIKQKSKRKAKRQRKPGSGIATSNLSISSTAYTLSENFISSNNYACIEINPHFLVKFIRKLRNNNQTELFLHVLVGRQSCESTFRRCRSLYETLQRLKRIQLLADIATKCSVACPELKFPPCLRYRKFTCG